MPTKEHYICHCGIYCVVPTKVSRGTYYNHLALAPEAARPQYELPQTPQLIALRDRVTAAQQAKNDAAARLRNSSHSSNTSLPSTIPQKCTCEDESDDGNDGDGIDKVKYSYLAIKIFCY